MSIVLEHIGDGKLAPTKAAERAEIVAKYRVGDRLVAELGQPRSRPQNKAHHAVFAKAFANVPESSPHQFSDQDHLRQWCYLRVKFKNTIVHYFSDGMTPKDVKRQTDSLIEQRRVWRDLGKYTEIRVVPEGLAWDIPKSWAFGRAKHKTATRVMEAILDELEALIPGMTREQLIKAVHKDAS